MLKPKPLPNERYQVQQTSFYLMSRQIPAFGTWHDTSHFRIVRSTVVKLAKISTDERKVMVLYQRTCITASQLLPYVRSYATSHHHDIQRKLEISAVLVSWKMYHPPSSYSTSIAPRSESWLLHHVNECRPFQKEFIAPSNIVQHTHV